MFKKILPILFVLLLALSLRLFRLMDIPPGLTHDEANHGREAMQILAGDLRYFFPLNYGSEPLYSYTAAAGMALFGEGLFALRLVNVIFGLAAVAATYIWAARAFDKQIALLSAALMAISFWPLASSREALRVGMLPFFVVMAVWFFWQIIYRRNSAEENDADKGSGDTQHVRSRIWLILGFAVSIALTFHIYLAARVSWLVFPVFLGYLALMHRSQFSRSWRSVLAGLVLAGLLVLPMFLYLANNPQSQTRLSMLGSTIESVQAGDIQPFVENAAEALLAFVWPGYGDHFIAYNIPGRPVFEPISALFFVAGILISLWRWKRPPYAFLLLWFLIGIIPSLVTGSTANTTRNMAALPAVLMLPAVGFVVPLRALAKRFSLPEKPLLITGALVWLIIAGSITFRDYFIHWGESPQVRGAYQSTLAAELAYWEKNDLKNPLALSTVYPGPVHDPSIALVLTGEDPGQARWFDARYGLIIPGVSGAPALIPDSTPPHAAFDDLLKPIEYVAMRQDDLDPGFTYYAIEHNLLEGRDVEQTSVDFGGALQLENALWSTAELKPGETAELLTIWRVLDPTKVGQIHLPADTISAMFFTHILGEDGNIIAQRDALDAPSWSWQEGDLVLQVHELAIPQETAPGSYQVVVGVYDPLTNERLLVMAENGPAGGSTAPVPPLKVAQ